MCDIKLFRNLEVEINKYVNLESFWLLKNNSFGYQSLASRERLFLDNFFTNSVTITVMTRVIIILK